MLYTMYGDLGNQPIVMTLSYRKLDLSDTVYLSRVSKYLGTLKYF